MKTERELFSEWLKHYENYDVKIDQLQRSFMWQAWQASASREGYVLIPVEMSQVKAEELATSEWNKNEGLYISINRELSAKDVDEFRQRWIKMEVNRVMNDYKAMVKENKYESL